ncbi:MAG TPA: hypothetical protein VIM55_17425 [Mucilaginibacter sp.]
MSNSIDFKALWNREETSAPDVGEIFARANKLNRNSRRKIMVCNILLILTIVFYGLMWWHFHPQMITTKIGWTLMIGAMVMYVISNYQLYPLLVKADMETDSHAFLSQMIRIKYKQESIDNLIIKIYFLLLAVGLGFYYIEYLKKGKLILQITVYGITLALLALNWFYLQERKTKKQHKAMNEIISKLEAVNAQLNE